MSWQNSTCTHLLGKYFSVTWPPKVRKSHHLLSGTSCYQKRIHFFVKANNSWRRYGVSLASPISCLPVLKTYRSVGRFFASLSVCLNLIVLKLILFSLLFTAHPNIPVFRRSKRREREKQKKKIEWKKKTGIKGMWGKREWVLSLNFSWLHQPEMVSLFKCAVRPSIAVLISSSHRLFYTTVSPHRHLSPGIVCLR